MGVVVTSYDPARLSASVSALQAAEVLGGAAVELQN
jgi:hypothetical protein